MRPFQLLARCCCLGAVILELSASGTGRAQMQTAPAAPSAASTTSQQPEAVASVPLPGALANREVTLTADQGTPLSTDDKYLLVLDRFTYGPRPRDLERLRGMGLNQWFSEQLNPQRIDDSALEARLGSFPALQLPLDKLMEQFPTNRMIRESLAGRISVPRGDAAHAIYADQQERYRDRKEKKVEPGKARDKTEVDVIPLPAPPADILAMEPSKRFKTLCHLTLPELRELRKELPPAQREHLTDGFTPVQVETLAAFNGPAAVIAAEEIQSKLLRDVYSERQLQEVMVDFWLNHFNVYMGKSEEAPFYVVDYERSAIRPYALRRFEELLLATASSPAMLNYLDAALSVGPHSDVALGQKRFYGPKQASGLNENYAREVMELHTIGVNGGYTQKDVTELAKVFTGWTVGKRAGEEVPAQAQFDASKHEPGDKVILGHRIKSDGQREGIAVLRMLAATPQCARFISTKLAIRFVGDDPPAAMIARMSATCRQSRGDIRLVLLAMVNSPEFFRAPTYRAKVKTPQDFVVSAVRAADSRVDNTAGMVAAVANLGMPVFGMLTPNGYSMTTEAWNNTTALVSRMNFAIALSTNRVAGITTDLPALLGPAAEVMSARQKTEELEAKVLHVPVSAKSQALILAQASADKPQQTAALRQIAGVGGRRNPLDARQLPVNPPDLDLIDSQAAVALGLILGSPEFQRR